MATYRKKERDYASWFDDPQFQDFVRSVHGGVGSIQDAENGLLPGGTDWANMFYQYWMMNQQNQWQQNMYAEDRAWQEDMYERYQSIGGQIDQMRQNGINPAMMYANGAVNAPGVSSGQMPSSGSGASAPSSTRPQSNSFQQLMGVFQMLTGVAGTGASLGKSISDIFRNRFMNERDDAQASNLKADTALKAEQERGLRINNDMSQMKLDVYDVMLGLSMDKTRSEIAKAASDFYRNQSVIYVNNTLAELNKANATKSQLQCGTELLNWLQKGLEIEKQQRLLPYAVELEEARINLLKAQKSESDSQVDLNAAMKSYYEAQTNFEQALIDAGAPEEQVKQLEANRKQSWVTAITGGLSQMIMAALGIFSVSKGAGPGKAGTRRNVPTIYGPDGKTPMSVDYGNMNLM